MLLLRLIKGLSPVFKDFFFEGRPLHKLIEKRKSNLLLFLICTISLILNLLLIPRTLKMFYEVKRLNNEIIVLRLEYISLKQILESHKLIIQKSLPNIDIEILQLK